MAAIRAFNTRPRRRENVYPKSQGMRASTTSTGRVHRLVDVPAAPAVTASVYMEALSRSMYLDRASNTVHQSSFMTSAR